MRTFVVRIPPVTVRVRSDLASVSAHLARFYADRLLPADSGVFCDFDIALMAVGGLRRIWRPQVSFLLDSQDPFLPLPVEQAPPLLEWGLNWCMASRPLGYLAIHAAVVARGADALVLPGFPGAGKSTLCSSLVFLDGWRLLSDELALLDPATVSLAPHPRPINLKNRSIDIVSAFPGSRLSPRYHDTRKGTVALAGPPADSLARGEDPAYCRWVVFPTFIDDGDPWCEPISRAESFALIAEQSFNKERMGVTGFNALAAMLDGAACYQIGYRSTAEALDLVARIRHGEVP